MRQYRLRSPNGFSGFKAKPGLRFHPRLRLSARRWRSMAVMVNRVPYAAHPCSASSMLKMNATIARPAKLRDVYWQIGRFHDCLNKIGRGAWTNGKSADKNADSDNTRLSDAKRRGGCN